MKVIDLLNKIANDEDVPYSVKYNERIYEYVEETKWYLREDLKSELFIDKNKLNDEIEIIEDTQKEDRYINVCGSLFTKSEYDELAKSKEDKKIEKDNLELDIQIFKYNPTDLETLIIREILKNRVKIKEIIDKVNGKDNEQRRNNGFF